MSNIQTYIATLLLVVLTCLPFQAFAYHADLDGLLKTYLKPVKSEGIDYIAVDYDGWAKDKRHKQVMDDLMSINPDTIESDSAKKAYWINVYNIFVVDMIAKTGERETVSNLGDALKSPFSTYKWKISGKEYTLDQIKNDILRPMGDPRIHFALNSATISDPDLRREAYRPARLEGQLRDQVLVSFKNPTKGIQFDGDIVRVPHFMKVNKMDFKSGDIKTWLKGYYPEHINADSEIGFFQQNWNLNKMPDKETAKK